MRNWNIDLSIGMNRKQRSFESTYEELKPMKFFVFSNVIFSFESTYEELKLNLWYLRFFNG